MDKEYIFGGDGDSFELHWRKKKVKFATEVNSCRIRLNDDYFLVVNSFFSGVGKYLDSLPINAQFVESSEDRIRIAPEGLNLSVEFKTLTEDKILYATDGAKFFLFIECPKGSLRMVPLPNVYRDSGVFCMPEGYEPEGDDIIEIAENGLDMIKTSYWNTDLSKEFGVVWTKDYEPVSIDTYAPKETHRYYVEVN